MNANDTETRDMLLIAGGAALLVLGAGLLLAHPAIRRTVVGSLTTLVPDQDRAEGLGGVIPDIQRYLRLRAM